MSFIACNVLMRRQRNIYCKSLKYSEKYYTKTNGIVINKWFYQNSQLQRPPHSAAHLLHHSEKTKVKVPKTWRKTLSLIRETWKTDKSARRQSLMYSAVITIIFFGSVAGFVKFLHFFGPGGGGRKWRKEIWDEIANKDADKAMEQMEYESNDGYIRNMFIKGAKPKLLTLEERAKQDPDRYRTWEDVMSKGFPESAEEYKRVSKMRPETWEDYEIMDKLKEMNKDKKASNAQ